MKRKRKRNKTGGRRTSVKLQSMIGAIIDMPMDEFEKQLIEQKVNLGIINNLILYLSTIYADLKTKKDGVLNLVFNGEYKKDDKVIKEALEGLYAEMTKIEQKVTFLKSKKKDLLKVD